MTTVPRITPADAHAKVASGGALLVCAYEEPEKFQDLQLEGAISLQEFRSHGASMPWDQEIIFYCASPDEEIAVAEATKTIARGFPNSKVLLGGLPGWRSAGFRVGCSA